ncbi:AP-5 complex subunit sigma-1 Adaptor-related protein complex 5 sigma subunit [Larimichthys crocea]|uniref:AP-5 complex subunit sigma-1 Adaptor-related protein complex 5 sigma subunit n=1 Tax=Larimichthys crocea TaxID=215358 RepID=A0A6G0IG56_LARCR|nr:AP-5 complex subunit sigma-1 Adaptor-related protein complex 5 sigma subunit [Larimichthys crocea]
MVRCFLIHTVCPLAALGPGDSRILYSRVFGPEEAERNRQLSPEEARALQKEKTAAVARQVRGAVSLSREASGRQLVEAVPGEEALALQEADSGAVRLRAGDPFTEETSALWLGVQSLGFTLVCEPHENLLLAEGTLRNLTRHCLEHLHMLGQGSEVLLRSNRIDALLSRLLPHGQLLFLNHRFAQSLEKEVAAYMAK